MSKVVVRLRSAVMAGAIFSSSSAWAANYYVSNQGSDSNDGTSPDSPWASVAKVNAGSFQPGDQILFARGSNWHESLNITWSGAAGNPITFDAYGDGAKPVFYGSDRIQRSTFRPTSNGVYVAPYTTKINAMLDDKTFMKSSFLATSKSTDDATNLDYVRNTPNSWYQTSSGQLYVNTNGVDPRMTGSLAAAVRDDVVHVFYQDNITVKNLVVDGSAREDRGYAFYVDNANNVVLDGCEAYRAGKHHFSAINANNFVGQNLYANGTMPQLVYGGASAYVSFSDSSRHGDTNDWDNIVGENLNGQGMFYSHQAGDGFSRVSVKNINSSGGWVDTALPSGVFSMQGGAIRDATLAVSSDGSVIDGVNFSGNHSVLSINSNNNTVQNIVASRINNSGYRYGSFLDNHGNNNIIRFSTFDMAGGSAFNTDGTKLGTQFYGNIIQSDSNFIDVWFGQVTNLYSDLNLFNGTGKFGWLVNPSLGLKLTYAQWQALGMDLNSTMGDPLFMQLENGDLRLQNGSPAMDALWSNLLNGAPLTDALGNPREPGSYLDQGAYEITVPEPTALAALGLGATLLLQRRRRG